MRQLPSFYWSPLFGGCPTLAGHHHYHFVIIILLFSLSHSIGLYSLEAALCYQCIAWHHHYHLIIIILSLPGINIIDQNKKATFSLYASPKSRPKEPQKLLKDNLHRDHHHNHQQCENVIVLSIRVALIVQLEVHKLVGNNASNFPLLMNCCSNIAIHNFFPVKAISE